MFDNFTLPDLTLVSRRTMLIALIFGVLGLIGTAIFGYVLVGLGLDVGISLGVVNFRLIQRSVVKIGEREEASHRRPLAMGTLSRLAPITVLALGALFWNFDLGLGIMAGLALFQAILLSNVTRSMLAMGKGVSQETEVAP